MKLEFELNLSNLSNEDLLALQAKVTEEIKKRLGGISVEYKQSTSGVQENTPEYPRIPLTTPDYTQLPSTTPEEPKNLKPENVMQKHHYWTSEDDNILLLSIKENWPMKKLEERFPNVGKKAIYQRRWHMKKEQELKWKKQTDPEGKVVVERYVLNKKKKFKVKQRMIIKRKDILDTDKVIKG